MEKEQNMTFLLVKNDLKGDYLNGQRNGNVKEYDEDGELEYEGEYLNGKRNGKGKEYRFGKLIYKGEYYNGFRKI